MVTICALTDATRDADGFKCPFWRDVHAVGIDKRVGVGDLAAQADGEATDRRPKAAAGFRYVAGKAEIFHSVRGFGKLAQEPARGFECAVNIPKRAGASETGELQAGG